MEHFGENGGLCGEPESAEARFHIDEKSGDGWIALPEWLGERFGWSVGDRVDIRIEDGGLVLRNLDADGRREDEGRN